MKSNVAIRSTRLVDLGVLTQQKYIQLNLSSILLRIALPQLMLSLFKLKSCFLLSLA
jgi:hypothetical protein